MKADLYTRRRLRLGALLYQLRYYADPKLLDAQGQIVMYRYDSAHYIEVLGAVVRLVQGDAVEVTDLEEAIIRCKAALAGQPLHRPAEQVAPPTGEEPMFP